MADDYWSQAVNTLATASDQTPVGWVLPNGGGYRRVSAAANAMFPTLGQSMESSQKGLDQYNQEMGQFQQQHPYLSTTGKVAGNLAGLAATGGILGAMAKGAQAAQTGYGAANMAAGMSAAARAAAPASYAPTLSNAMNAARAVAPSWATVTNAVKTGLNYGPAAALTAAPIVAAVKNSGQSQDNSKVSGFDQGPTGKFSTAAVRQQTPEQAAAAFTPAGAGQGGAGAQAGAMFPGDDPSASLRVRMMLAKLSPRPHYATAADRAGALAMRLAQERYDRAIQRAGGDQKMMDEAEDNRLAAVSGVAKAGGVWGQMGLAAPQPQQDDGWLW